MVIITTPSLGLESSYVCLSNKPFIGQGKKSRDLPTQFSEMSTPGTRLPGIIYQSWDTQRLATSLLGQVYLS